MSEVKYMVNGDYIADFNGLSKCLAFECEALRFTSTFPFNLMLSKSDKSP